MSFDDDGEVKLSCYTFLNEIAGGGGGGGAGNWEETFRMSGLTSSEWQTTKTALSGT